MTQCRALENPGIIELFCKTPALLQWVLVKLLLLMGPFLFPIDVGITLHSQMRFHFLRTSAFCTPYFILGLTLTQVLSYSRIFFWRNFHAPFTCCDMVFYESSSNSAEQCRIFFQILQYTLHSGLTKLNSSINNAGILPKNCEIDFLEKDLPFYRHHNRLARHDY